MSEPQKGAKEIWVRAESESQNAHKRRQAKPLGKCLASTVGPTSIEHGDQAFFFLLTDEAPQEGAKEIWSERSRSHKTHIKDVKQSRWVSAWLLLWVRLQSNMVLKLCLLSRMKSRKKAQKKSGSERSRSHKTHIKDVKQSRLVSAWLLL